MASYQELTVESLSTPEGMTLLNTMLLSLFNLVGGDGETIRVYSGYGTPENNISAGVGSLYLRFDGGASTTLYVKESGTGDTGWIGK